MYKPNPRQYVGSMAQARPTGPPRLGRVGRPRGAPSCRVNHPQRPAQMPGLEVWFQRASDVVRKLTYGDVDLGIVGHDMFAEIGNGDPSLIMLHDALNFGKCHLGLGVPTGGRFAGIDSLDQLRRRAIPQAGLRVSLTPSGQGCVSGPAAGRWRCLDTPGQRRVRPGAARAALHMRPPVAACSGLQGLPGAAATVRALESSASRCP